MLKALLGKLFDSVAFYACAIVGMLAFASGWTVRGWFEDSRNLAIERAAAAIEQQALARESVIAAKVEQRLAELKANQTVIDRGIIRETEKPVYRNVCLPDSHVIGLLNAAAQGAAADPAELAGEVPGEPGAAD